MNHIRWAAWGVINIEKLERMQRRNYIKRARVELAEKNIKLECGGSTQTLHYAVTLPAADSETSSIRAAKGVDAFRMICQWVLEQIGDTENEAHERGEDGGVRSAGAQA